MTDVITPESIATSILLLRAVHKGSVLIVEGYSDSRLYGKFIDGDNCQIVNAYNKSSAVRVTELLEKKNFFGIVTIVDADFWSIEGYEHPSSNILRTDTHDLETMLVSSPALDHVLAEYGSQDKIMAYCRKSGAEIRESIIQVTMPIGCLRLESKIQSLNLRFEELKFTDFVRSRKGLSLDIKRLVKAVVNHSKRHDISQINLVRSIQADIKRGYDAWQVSCGHDAITIISIALRSLVGTNNTNDVKPDVLEKSLRLAYQFSHFHETRLYSSLSKWEDANNLKVVMHVP